MDVIKDTKIGQGLKFLSGKLTGLKQQLQIWLEELVDMGKSEQGSRFTRGAPST